MDRRFESLEQLREFMETSHHCPLEATRTNLVFGSGDSHAAVMFIGEAPGKNEDLQGVPFVGAAGKLLDELLESIGLTRDQVYIANILKCRPPGNRNPQAEEIDACAPYLREQVRLIDPEVIVTLGNFATRFVLKCTDGITRLRGSVQRVGKFTVVPMFHPAAALYDVSKRDVLFRDFQVLAGLLPSPSEEGSPAAEPVQGSLFEE